MTVAPSPAREAVRGTVPKMIEVAEEVIYGDIWERPGLSKRDRSLIVVASLISQYRPEQLRGHLVRALDHGVTREEIAEIITHLAFYSGWPGSMTAANIAREVFEFPWSSLEVRRASADNAPVWWFGSSQGGWSNAANFRTGTIEQSSFGSIHADTARRRVHRQTIGYEMSQSDALQMKSRAKIPWSSLFLLWTCGASLRLTILAVPPVISIIQQDLHLSGTEVGLLSGIPVILFALAATPGSTLVARLGVRRALLVGLTVTAVGAALRAASANSWQLYLTSILMSSGVAIMQPVMAAAVRAWVPDRAIFGTAVYTNGLIVGEVIPVAVMLPILLPYFGNWRAALGIWSVPVIATAILVAILQPTSHTPVMHVRYVGFRN